MSKWENTASNANKNDKKYTKEPLLAVWPEESLKKLLKNVRINYDFELLAFLYGQI
jgi:hypothetical protein